MLFNSYAFIIAFLPVVLIGFFCISRYSETAAAGWLAAASLFFYGWWNVKFVALLVLSILFNYWMAHAIVSTRSRLLLISAIAVDLAALAYFKYANFLVDNLNAALGMNVQLSAILLPIGISFFTFTQIAFLMDTWNGKATEYRLTHYFLFVAYFPHLIAGPVLHHRQMMPQFAEPRTYRLRWDNLALGVTIFAVGLLKKTVIADGVAAYATPAFDAAAHGQPVYFFEAWMGALAYTLQLYFDFSGYCDMAIGLSRMFNIKLPLNFHSPYKSHNIIEFWRRWHMTLSQFLRDYLYIPLGGNRKGPVRRYANLMTTMLLGGLWHGAGWTFVVWGALHGFYLVVNHGWQALWRKLRPASDGNSFISHLAGCALTFLAVVIAWVFFRAADLGAACHMVRGMAGLNGVSLPSSFAIDPRFAGLAQSGALFQGLLTYATATATEALVWIGVLCLAVWLLPNTQQLARDFDAAYESVGAPPTFAGLRWNLSSGWATLSGIILALGLLSLNRVSAFLYFQF